MTTNYVSILAIIDNGIIVMTDQKQPVSFFKRIQNAIENKYNKATHYVISTWDKYRTQIEKFTHYTMAAKSATTTFHFSIGLLPILGSMLTTLAGIQFLQFLVPEFLYSPFFYFPLFIGVSGLAGYKNYKDQIERAKLDHQIVENKKVNLENKQVNEKLGKTIEQLEKTLAANQEIWQSHVKTYQKNPRNHRTKPAPTRELRSSTMKARTKLQPARLKKC